MRKIKDNGKKVSTESLNKMENLFQPEKPHFSVQKDR